MNTFIDSIGLTTFIAIDLETTGLNPKHDKIIEISAVKFHQCKPIDTFTYLINPKIKITTITTQITGITNIMVENQPMFEDIENKFISFIEDYPLVGHNVMFDLDFLKYNLRKSHLSYNDRIICDTFYLSKIFYYYYNSFSLSSLCDKLKIPILNSHRAEIDAKNSGFLFVAILKNEIQYSNLLVFQKLKECIGNFNVPNNKLFDNIIRFLIKNPNSSGVQNKDHSLPHFFFNLDGENQEVKSIDDFFKEDGLVENHLQNYELREKQIEFSKDIFDSFHSKHILVAEAGAGLGKSYAYLFASLLYAKETVSQVVISTNTHSLQNQLFKNDIPFVFKVLNQKFKVTIIKGINNYLCLTRLEKLLKEIEDKINENQAMELMALVVWIQNTKTGDISECNGFNHKYNNYLWSLINSRSENCLTYKCNKHGGCYYRSIKESALESDVLIVNHSMLISYQDKQDLFIKNKAVCIVDECHNFHSICKKQSSQSIGQKKIIEQKKILVNHISRLSKNNASKDTLKDADRLLTILDDLLVLFSSFCNELYTLNINDSYESEYIQNIPINRNNVFPEGYVSGIDFLVKLSELFTSCKRHKTILNKEFINDSSNNFLLEFNFLLKDIEEIYFISDNIIKNKDESINWFSYRFYNSNLDSFSLHSAPNDLAIITRKIFNNFSSTLLCSATLSTNSGFEFFLRQMGLSDLVFQDSIKIKKYSSPYFYSDQTKLFIINSNQELNEYEYIKQIGLDIVEISQKLNKRILVLCTAFRQIYDFEKIINNLKHNNKNFLFQTKGTSKNVLISEYLQKKDSVLFGTNTFWEGLDFPEDKLEVLIIFKLPFSNPKDPYIKANIDYYLSNNLDAFTNYQLEDTIIKLKQGFGRLIRSYNDMGVCIITDPRIMKKRYGKHIIDSLPVEPNYYSNSSFLIHEIEKFLK